MRCNLYRSLLIPNPICCFNRQQLRKMALDSAGGTSLLLDREDVPPVLELNSAGRSPFLLTCDHYGRAIPRILGDLGLPAGEFARHIASDGGIARVSHALSKHLDANLPPLLLKLLRAETDLVVGDNEPYAVSDETDYTIPVHGEARGLMNSGLEIRQDLLADPAGQSQWADRLARILAEIEVMMRAQRLLPG